MADEFEYLNDQIEATGVTLEKTDDSTNGADSQSGASTESGTSTESTQVSIDKVEGAPAKDNVGSAGDNKQQPGQKEKGQNPNSPGPQDLTLRDGTVVKAGAERRWYENAQLARAREVDVRNQLNTANQKYQNIEAKYTELSSAVKQIGFDKPEEMKVAVSLYTDLARDPVGTVTKLLAELKAKGYTVDGIGSAVDTKAITDILDRKLQPSAETQQRQTQEQIAQEVDKEVNDLFSRFPDAQTHEAMLARVVEVEASKGNQIPLVEAYFALRQKAINEGLDWSKPLGPQLEAKRQGQQQQQQQAPRTQGRGATAAAASEIDPAQVFQPKSDSTADIVRAAMQEAGMKV
jgi:hypothetical protein